MFLSTLALLTAVKTDLSARHYSQPTPNDPAVLSTDLSKPLLFERVEFFSNKNLQQALQQLRLMDNRICLLVPIGDDYTNTIAGNTLTSQRATEFMLMLADRDFSIEAGKMTASFDTPGILALKDLAVEALMQSKKIVSDRGTKFVVAFQPGVGAVIQLEWEQKDTPELVGRECFGQIFRVNASVQHVAIGRI
jgi:hypothetical protein